MEKGFQPSPIFKAPWVTANVFRIDWLHAVDHGVAADFLGCVFWLCMKHFPGNSTKVRCDELWRRMLDYYKRNRVEDRLTSVLPVTIKQVNKKPMLRASAAQVRALVPFAQELTAEVCAGGRTSFRIISRNGGNMIFVISFENAAPPNSNEIIAQVEAHKMRQCGSPRPIWRSATHAYHPKNLTIR